MTNTKQIKVQQAFYGELKKGHGCLDTTVEDSSLNAYLTAFTDRPGALPAGMKLKPYYSGTKYDRYYIFTLTFPDDNASRGGIVFTHALIFEVDDLEYINNLAYVFSLFCKEIPTEWNPLAELSVEGFRFALAGFPETFPKYTIRTVQLLTGGALPIVFCGDSDEFIKLIAAIWGGLATPFRSIISFTAGFAPSSIDKTKTFIHFQSDLIDSLINTAFVSGDDSEEMATDSPIEKFILTPQTDRKFETFLSKLKVDITSWNILNFSAKAYEEYSNVQTLDNDSLKQLIRLIAKISPKQSDGNDIKTKLIDALQQRVLKGQESHIKSLRNLPLASFPLGEEKIVNALLYFIENELQAEDLFRDELIAEAINIVNSETDKNWWHEVTLCALQNGIRSKSDTCFRNLWKLLNSLEDSLPIVLDSIPPGVEYEYLLIKNMPLDISQVFAEKLIGFTTVRHWSRLRSNLLVTYLPPEQALLEQFAFEKKIKSTALEGTKMIIPKVSSDNLQEIVLKTKEAFFVDEFVARLLVDSALLNDLDIKEPFWLEIWGRSLEHTDDLSYGVIDLPEKIEFLLNEISEGRVISEVITKKIAESSFADLTNLKNRANIWRNIRTELASLFLNATAEGLLKDISSTGLSGIKLESELCSYIATDGFMTSFLSRYKKDIDTVLEVYEHIPKLRDRFLADYIKYFSRSLKEMQSERLGNLVKDKGFKETAWQIFQKAKFNNSYRIALNKCRSLISLNLLDRLMYGHLFGERLSKEEVYSALAEICIELYPKGPEDRDIWNRAEGDVSKLYESHSREQNWRTAINLLKNGGGGKKITVKLLLEIMIEDFPNNTQLKHIIKIFK